MNRICAAGAGSFVEEQATRMDIPLAEFDPLALNTPSMVELGERHTAFIETIIQSAPSRGASQTEAAVGPCQSVVRNCLHRAVGVKPVGSRVVL